MKIYILLLVLLIHIPFAYGNKEITHQTTDLEISGFSADVDSLLRTDHPDSAKMELLLKKLQRLNWNKYYEKHNDQGPVLKLVNYCRTNRLVSGEIACNNGFGVMYRQLGKSSAAERNHLAALKLSEDKHDTINIMVSLNNLGVNSRRIDDLRKASNYHMMVLNLAEHFSNQSNAVQKSKCIALNSLGNINISLKQYEKAIKIFRQSNLIEQTMNSLIGQAVNLANIGEAFELLGQIDSAKYNYEQSLRFNEKAESVLGIALSNNNLGNICLKKKQYDQSLSYFEHAIMLTRTTGDKYHLVISLESAADVWIEKKQYKQAFIFLDEAIEVARSINAKIFLKEGYLKLSKIRAQTGNYHESLDFLTLSHQYSDSIFNDENQRHLNEIQTKYETEQKEQQIILLNKERELNRQHLRIQTISLWGLAILSLFVLVVILLIYRQHKIQSRTREIELNQKMLRSQMNPHFIFNSLGAIQNFMIKNDGRKAALYLSRFASLMRSILKNSREEMITLHEEKQTIENYLNLHQLRLGENLSFAVTVSNELDADYTMLPPMLVQPFVENAILHGIEKMDVGGHISVTFNKDGDQLLITVTDNGQGIENRSNAQNTDHVSYALQIFKERIANLKKSHRMDIFYNIENMGLTIDKNPGTIVTVKIPLKTN